MFFHIIWVNDFNLFTQFEYEKLQNRIVLINKNNQNVKDFNSMKEIFFETCVGVDDILDKINELGVESLTELDKKILQS